MKLACTVLLAFLLPSVACAASPCSPKEAARLSSLARHDMAALPANLRQLRYGVQAPAALAKERLAVEMDDQQKGIHDDQAEIERVKQQLASEENELNLKRRVCRQSGKDKEYCDHATNDLKFQVMSDRGLQSSLEHSATLLNARYNEALAYRHGCLVK
jgi:hypothetical protein